MKNGTRLVKRIRPHLNESGMSLLLYIAGFGLLGTGIAEFSSAGVFDGGLFPGITNFDDTMLRLAVCQLYRLIEGAYGALLMTVAGIGAIAGAAFGNYKAAYQMLAVGLGAFVLRSLVSLWFGTDFDQCRSLTIGIPLPPIFGPG